MTFVLHIIDLMHILFTGPVDMHFAVFNCIYFGEHSEAPLNIKLCKRDNCISEHNILHLASELTSVAVKILKFPMCMVSKLS